MTRRDGAIERGATAGGEDTGDGHQDHGAVGFAGPGGGAGSEDVAAGEALSLGSQGLPFMLADAAPVAAAAAAGAGAVEASDAPPLSTHEPFLPTAELLRFCEPFSEGDTDASERGILRGSRAPSSSPPQSSTRTEHSGSNMRRPKLKVALLLSGGVDSSVALALLQAAGHECTAFYLQIWFQEDFRNFWDQCPWEDDLLAARGVCDVLGVPLEVVPLTDQYWDLVVSHSIAEISQVSYIPQPVKLALEP